MEEIISVTCPEKHASLAASDVVGQLHGVLNFKVLEEKLGDLSSMFEEMQQKVNRALKELKAVEESLANRNKFRSEEQFCKPVNKAGPACHCHYYAFRKVDPIEMLPGEGDTEKLSCGHYHHGGCVTCDQIDAFPKVLDELGNDASEEVRNKLLLEKLSSVIPANMLPAKLDGISLLEGSLHRNSLISTANNNNDNN